MRNCGNQDANGVYFAQGTNNNRPVFMKLKTAFSVEANTNKQWFLNNGELNPQYTSVGNSRLPAADTTWQIGAGNKDTNE